MDWSKNLLKYLAFCQVKMVSYSMNNFWDKMVDFMNNAWDKSIEGLAKLNAWIPLSTILVAGAGLIAVCLILGICGCILRKRLIPHWLIWTYFTFAVIIIFAHAGNNLAAIVEAIEIPVLVVLICYILMLIFRRCPRYVYVERAVYERQLAKGRVCSVKADDEEVVDVKAEKQAEKAKKNKKDKNAKEVEFTAVSESEQEDGKEEKFDAEIVDEVVDREAALREAEKNEREAEAAKVAIAEKAAREAREQEQEQERKAVEMAAHQTSRSDVKEEPVRRVDKTDFLTARTVRPNLTSSTATATVELPTVNPIPDKSYEPMREPTIVTRPISQTIPGLKTTGSSSSTARYSSSFSRPTTATTVRPNNFGSTASRPTTTTSSTNNAFSSMYNPRIVKTTTTTVNTTPSSTTSSSFSRSASSSATSVKSSSTTTTANTHSTEDIMAAIERLRNSMKK